MQAKYAYVVSNLFFVDQGLTVEVLTSMLNLTKVHYGNELALDQIPHAGGVAVGSLQIMSMMGTG